MMKYKKKVSEAEEGMLWRECWRVLERGMEETERKKVRGKELNKRWVSLAEYHSRLKEKEQMWAEIEKVDNDT